MHYGCTPFEPGHNPRAPRSPLSHLHSLRLGGQHLLQLQVGGVGSLQALPAARRLARGVAGDAHAAARLVQQVNGLASGGHKRVVG